MKLVLDAQPDDAGGVLAAAVEFDAWDAPVAGKTYTARLPQLEKKLPGELDLRLLPALLHVLHAHRLQPEAIVLDGFVHLDAQETPGLGQHLFHALGGRVPVIGISKKPFADTPAQFEVMREEETAPLVVTCAGVDLGAAKARVRTMHGRKRIPTLVKLAARIARGRSEASTLAA